MGFGGYIRLTKVVVRCLLFKILLHNDKDTKSPSRASIMQVTPGWGVPSNIGYPKSSLWEILTQHGRDNGMSKTMADSHMTCSLKCN